MELPVESDNLNTQILYNSDDDNELQKKKKNIKTDQKLISHINQNAYRD